MKLRDVHSPTALKMKIKTSVHDTRPVSQAHLDLSTAEIPKKMKIMVSAMLARVFIVYLTVVRDFWEMLASTYLLAPIPQNVILGGEMQKPAQHHPARRREEAEDQYWSDWCCWWRKLTTEWRTMRKVPLSGRQGKPRGR